MEKRKHILSMLLLITTCLFSNNAFAYDAKINGIYYNFSGYKATVTYRSTSYNSYTGDVVIPKSVVYNAKTYSVTSIGERAFYDCSALTSVTIPNSVTSIGYGAFAYCSGLTSVTIPNSVTSIDRYAFYYCYGLTSVNIPNSVTSIGKPVFSGCSGLTSVKVEAGNATYDSRDDCNAIIETATNTLIQGCNNTTIPNSVTSIGERAFYGSGLTSVTIPNSVTNIGNYAFAKCN